MINILYCSSPSSGTGQWRHRQQAENLQFLVPLQCVAMQAVALHFILGLTSFSFLIFILNIVQKKGLIKGPPTLSYLSQEVCVCVCVGGGGGGRGEGYICSS